MLYECSIDEYNLRKFSPDYSIHLLQEALNLSNNSMDKEEINSKIALFQKKGGKLQPKQNNQSGGEFEGCAKVILLIIISQLGWAFLVALIEHC
jgi:hypothetical protein